jgi:hypothetical protein
MKPKTRYILIPFLLTIIALLLFKVFSSNYHEIEGIKINTDSIKVQVYRNLSLRSKLIEKANKSDSVRTIYVTRWREKIKPIVDSIPCDSALKIVVQECDTIIVKDSVAISDLKRVIVQDSIIITDQQKIIQGDSIQILGLKKDLKKQKRLTRLVAAIAVVLGDLQLLDSLHKYTINILNNRPSSLIIFIFWKSWCNLYSNVIFNLTA